MCRSRMLATLRIGTDRWSPRRARTADRPGLIGHYALRSRYRFVVRRRVWDAARMCPHGGAWVYETATGLNPALANVVRAWSDAGHWATAVDGQWRRVFVSEELRAATQGEIAIGEFEFGPACVDAQLSGSAGANSIEVVAVGDGERSWQPAGRTRLRGMKADTPYHVPSETR